MIFGYRIESIQQVEDDYLDTQYEIIDKIGYGAFSTVYSARHKEQGYICAVKQIGNWLSLHIYILICIDKALVPKVQRITNEVRFYQLFSQQIDNEDQESTDDTNISRFIARHYSVPVQTTKYVFIFMEYYSKGDLHNFWMQKQGLMEVDSKYVLRNLIEIAQLLHEKGVVLRDIKPENWVIDNQGYLRLIDFNHWGFLEDSEDGLFHEVVGTIGYMSPEVLTAK